MTTTQARKTRLCRFQHESQTYAWLDVERETYRQGQAEGREWKNIVRQILVGKRAEETHFHLRYFEIACTDQINYLLRPKAGLGVRIADRS